MRRLHKFSKIFHLIADTHAIKSGLDPLEVHSLADRQRKLINNALANLGLEAAYEVVLASEIDSLEEYKSILDIACSKVDESVNAYFKHEAADIE